MWGGRRLVRHWFCFGIDYSYMSDKYVASFRRLFFCTNIALFMIFFLPNIVAWPDRFFLEKPRGIIFCTDKSGLGFIFAI